MFNEKRIDKFFSKVKKTSRCWIWQGAVHITGSGSFYVGDKGCVNTTAHRFSYIIHFGEISSTLIVNQKCRNKLCVNPKHLQIITRSETGNKPPSQSGKIWDDARKLAWSIKQKGKLGRKHSTETRRKLSLLKKGAKGSNWQGGKTDESKTARKTIEYKIWRDKVFERDDFTCLKCNQKGGRLHPHHIFNFAQYKHLRYEEKNGATLCVNCHKKFHAKYGKKKNDKNQFLEFIEAQLAIVEAGQAVMEEVFLPYAVMPATNQTFFQTFTENSQKLLGK